MYIKEQCIKYINNEGNIVRAINKDLTNMVK